MVDTPTPAELKEKFPYFAAVEDNAVSEYIAEAGRDVDDSWLAGDQARAVTYLACHLMYLNGVTSPDGAPPGGGGGSGFVQSKSIGDSSVSYGTTSYLKGSGSVNDELRSTVWGRRYLSLLSKNNPAVLIV